MLFNLSTQFSKGFFSYLIINIRVKKTTSLNFNTRLVEVKKVEDSENKFQTGNVELEVSNFDSDNDAEINKHPYLLNVIMQAEFRWPNNWAEKK